MSSQVDAIKQKGDQDSGSFKSYVIGFLLSLLFTLAAYTLVVRHEMSNRTIIVLIVGFALLQFLTQLFFFLHLGKETSPRWKLLALGFMIMIVSILVFGSLWIMSNLNYRMMTPTQEENYVNSQGGF